MRRIVVVACLVALPLGACSSGSTSSKSSADAAGRGSDEGTLYSFTLMRRGSVLLQQGRYQDALEAFEEASQHQPGNATVYNMIGLCHLKMVQYDQALQSFSNSINLVPSFTDARNNRGATYLAMGQYRLAEVDFMAVLGDSTYPHRWEAYYNLGMTYLQRGRLGAAEENLRRAATAPSPIFDAFLRLAEISVEKQNIDNAIDLLEEAMLKFPDRVEPAFQLGRLLMEQGREDEARPHLRRVIESDGNSELANQARLLLEIS